MSGTIGSTTNVGMAPQARGSSVLTPLGDAGVSGGGETTQPTAEGTDVSGGATADPAAAGATAAPAAPAAPSQMPTMVTVGGLFGMAGGAAGFHVASKKLAQESTDQAVRTLTQRLAQNGAATIGADMAAVTGAKVLGMKPGLVKMVGLGAMVAGTAAFGLGMSARSSQKTAQAAQEQAKLTEQQTLAQLQAYDSEVTAIQAKQLEEIAALRAQVGGGATADPAAAAGTDPAAATDPATGTPAPGGDEAAATAALTGQEAAPMIQLPNVAGTGAAGATGATNPTGVAGTSAAGPVGATSSALIGSTIDLAAGVGATGAPIAEAGTYAIAQDLGSFATLDEANAAVRATMDPEAMGTRFMRYAVVQTGTTFHPVVATALEGGQPKPLSAAQGTVVAWNALGHISDAAGNSGWQAYSWTAQGGATSIAVPYGQKPFPSGIGTTPTTTPTGTTTPVGVTTPSTTAPTTGLPTVAGGGTVAPTTPTATAFDPSSVLGRTFAANASTTPEGAIVAGGSIQLQGFVASSTGGFGTADQAAVAARQARAALPASNPYARVVTMQGADGRFYVYQASVVARETAPLQNAAPMHVFGAGFASYYDGATAAWQSLTDK